MQQSPAQLPAKGPVVGFDLDLTLVDSAAGIARTMRAALSAEQAGGWAPGEPADDVLRGVIGIPLEASIGLLAPDADADRVAAVYRRLYPELGVPATVLLPGVTETFAAVRAAGGRVLVVSAKTLAAVHAVLAHVGLEPDLVAGDLFAGQKGRLLLAEGAHAYVGDHPGDMEAARVARATGVGVLTGSTTQEALRAAGADVVLPDLRAFPAWLEAWWAAPSGAAARSGLDDEARERDGEADGAEQRQRRDHAGRGAVTGPQGDGHAERQQPHEEDDAARGDEAAGAAVAG
jgi:phosphoglycolate phosphatase-like HAD superfamily hydrolase